MSVKPGQTLGQYQIVEQIGKGGMATVFRSWQPSLARHVAIKVLPEFFSDDPGFQYRFRQEAMAIAQLRHPNVLTVFDSGEADGVAYIVTELVEGGTLASRLGNVLTIDECVKLVGPVASALDYAHARGMVHRDVKPANILIAPDGVPILSDFGLARMTGGVAADATRMTLVGSTLGTPEYMAPEQIETSDVGPAADVYSLAVILYEMLTGSVPYSADTPVSVLMARLQNPLPRPRDRNPDLSDSVQTVLLKGLAKNAAERYASAGEMLRALEEAGHATLPRTATTATSFPARSGGWLVAAAVIVIAVAVFAWSRSRQAAATTSVPVATPPAAVVAIPSQPAPLPAKVEPKLSTPPAAVVSANVPAPAPAAAPAPASDGLPPHGPLLYSLTSAPAEAVAPLRRLQGDLVVEKDGALEFTAGTDGVHPRVPVEGIGDFVAVLRYVVTERRPFVTFRFRQSRQGQGYAIRWPAFLNVSPPAKGAPPAGAHGCCLVFDMFVAPQNPNTQSLLPGPQPVTVPSRDGEEQVLAISAVGPVITMFAGGREIARTTDSSLGPGGMTLSITAGRAELPARLRILALDVFEPPATARTHVAAPTAAPARGKRLFAMADHVAAMAQLPQQPDNTITVSGTSLDLKVGGDGLVMMPLGMNGIGDFIAVLKFAPLTLSPMLRFRFGGDHLLQIPAFHRLGTAAEGVPSSGSHPCCQDFDLLRLPQAPGTPTLFTGPPPRAVAAAPNQEQTITVSVRGSLIVVQADGHEIARVNDETLKPGGIAIEVGAQRRQVPAAVRLNALDIYEAP